MIKKVFIFNNGVVAVTNEKGKQMPSLQGKWSEKAEKIYKKANWKTIWYDGRAI